MAEADWGSMADAVAGSSILSGVSAGFIEPAGGGSFVFGFNSLVSTAGVAGRYVDLANFNPYVKGVSIRGALRRGPSAAVTGSAPMLWAGIQSNPPSVNDPGYLLLLSDANPHVVVLRKGDPSGPVSATGTGVLAVGSTSYEPNTWLHLRMDVITNPNGDVVINCFQNDLASNNVTSPVWAAIPGISQVIDDALQVLTGSAPLVGGFVGFAFQSNGLNQRGYLDHVQALRQV